MSSDTYSTPTRHEVTPLNLLFGRRRLPRSFAGFIVAACVAFGGCGVASAQVGGFNLWQEISEQQAAARVPAALKSAARRDIVPQAYRTLALDKQSMAQLLDAAPAESASRDVRSGSEIILPLPQGGFGRFSVLESPLMEPALAAQFPEIKNYIIQGIDDPTATGRIDTSPKGFRAMVISASGTFFIDPYWSNSDDASICYAKKDFAAVDKMQEWSCGVVGDDSPIARAAKTLAAQPRPTGATLRVYRAAIAATGEYTTFHGGTVPLALAAINTTLARVNTVYERDFCIRMVLVANNTSIIYTNASTDPYTNGDPGSMIDENQANVDSVIGDANYDIGHVFGTNSGGLAGLGVVCETGQKASGVTGSSAPVNDPFDIDYVAHEIGHQFGGNHTFNGTSGSAAGNRNASTAFEPGSGSTVMAYAGICAPQDLQANSDDHFHTGSYTEIDNYTSSGTGAGAFSKIATGNTPPVIGALSNYTVPAQTPFALTATATDANGDSLTYCWEEYDLGPAQNPIANPRDNGSSTIFRSYKPTTNATRLFPSLQYILNNTNNPPATYTKNGKTWATGEALPTTSRTMTYRVSVRDNRAGGGGQNWASAQVSTVSTAGPFRISSQNTASTLSAGTPFSVTWDVSGTAAAPISATSVKISLSTNGGTNFPIVLAASVPNSGTASVTIPSGTTTTTARLKIEAVDNIFFDVNDANLAVVDPGMPVVRIDSPAPGARFLPFSPVKVQVTATDLAPGTISQVALYVDDELLETDVAAPYEFNYVPSSLGNKILKATATDNEGNTGVSQTVQILISYPSPGEVVGAFVPPSLDGPVQALAADAVGRIYLGGNFTMLNGTAFAPRVARLRYDGTVDQNSFFPGSGANGQVRALAYSAKDKALYAGGSFTTFDGMNRRALTRLAIGRAGKNDGSLDAFFDAQIEGLNANDPPYVQVIALQSDGKIIIGGSFSRVLGQARLNLARLMADGSLDLSFAPNPNGPVNAIALQPDGRILVGGDFGSLNGVSGFGRIARLNKDGSVDTTFQTGGGFNGPVNAISVTLDGDVLVGGQFTSCGPFLDCNRLAKLSSTGVLDRKFNASPGLDNEVSDILIRSSGSLLVSGYFSSVGNAALRSSTVQVGRIMQMNTGGALDAGFNPAQSGANGPITDTIALPNGDILVAGGFSTFNGTARQSLAVVSGFSLNAPGVTSPTFRNISAGDDLDEYFLASAAGSFVLVDANGNVQAPDTLLPRGVKFDAATGRLYGVPLDGGERNIYIKFVPAQAGSASSITRYLLYVNPNKVTYAQWKRAWFTNPVDLVDDAVSGPNAVCNGVGANNMAVYALDGGDPFTMNAMRMPVVGFEKYNRKNYLTLRAAKYTGAQAAVIPEFSTDLASWVSSPDQLGVTDNGNGVVARPVVPAGDAEKQFLRLKILPQ